MIPTYSIEYLTKNLSGDWSRLNNPILGFPDMQTMIIYHYEVVKK